MRERRAVAVHGVVQGVGFRPFVHGLAARWHLAGFVRNQAGCVLIEVEGQSPSLDGFLTDLTAKAPPLARIENVKWERSPLKGEFLFRIEPSKADRLDQIFVSPDIGTCDACLAEMFDPYDRRHRYPFVNCTNCGPRLTIITAAPYDRPNTTMADFVMCPACRAEYEDPVNRRFHAQPTCCPVCGPRLRLVDRTGKEITADDPIAVFAAALCAGQIGALKGLGGYHLACAARDGGVVAELRRRKHRDEKPFAVMVADEGAAGALCHIGPEERVLLRSPGRPIVLMHKRLPCDIAPEVAPGNPCLGIMLPYTPVHHLLLRAVGNVPLVMTSGNRADEPIAIDDADALTRLADIADLFLVHNRPIHVRCDDSVTRVVDGAEMPLRRSRGCAPAPIALPLECLRPILAVGGQLKGTFALGRGRHAFVSHHLGDLDYYAAYQAFVKDLLLYEKLFAIKPQLLVHDLHPDYASTRYARERGEKDGLPLLAVQHHHAHMASCMAEHGLTEPVIGVSFDGTGYGTDGAIWGGEFLVGDCQPFPPGGPFALRRHAGRRAGDPRTVAHGAGSFAGCRGKRCIASAACSRRLVAHCPANAGARFQHADDIQCGPTIRCRGRAGGRARHASASKGKPRSNWSGSPAEQRQRKRIRGTCFRHAIAEVTKRHW